jgi:hypothetical protein
VSELADAILYYRTEATKKSIIPDPVNLPAAQKLVFTYPDKILEGSRLRGVNNIKQFPFSNSDGIKKVGIQVNGLLERPFILRGHFKNDTLNADMKKLLNFCSQKGVDTFHIYGQFGFYSPNAVALSLDPDDTVGYTIQTYDIGRLGRKDTIYDFELTLAFGGTVPTL